jgi:crotonobetainyl-CoA:carnitine CoA-transferase CaiB-like acyl-CoA transferase
MNRKTENAAHDGHAATAGWPEPGGADSRPLSGIRVLDLSRILAGPFCTMILADLGADVLKVESPAGDQTRRWGPPFVGDTAAYYYAINRNKRSVVLEFETDDGQRTLRDLVREADVVVHNFPAPVAERLGLDAATVSELNPRCIYCGISAYGAGAPDRTGYDLVMQAYGGLMSITGEPDRPAIKTGVAISDLAAGLFGAIGILALVVRREQSGVGGDVSLSLLDSVLSLLANQAMNWLLCGVDPGPMASEHPNVVPYGVFRAADGDIVLGVGSDPQFARLCEVLEAPELATDSRFSDNERRIAHRSELKAILEALLASRTADEWERRLAERRVPAAKIRRISEVFRDPLVVGGALSQVMNGAAPLAQVLIPLVVDGQRLQPYLPPPKLGEHTAAVVRDPVNGLVRPAGANRRPEA